MKRLLAQLSFTAIVAIVAAAGPLEPLPAPKPPTLFVAPVRNESFVYTDKPALVLAPLVSPSAARIVTERFQAAYAKLGQPRLLIRINPQARTLSNPNAPAASDSVKQEELPAEARELLPLFMRLFVQAGGRVLEKETGAEAAEIVIEVLAATRRLPVREVSGDRVHLVPELQLAAVRLADGRLLAQVSVRELFGTDAEAARLLRHFKLAELGEAAALRLMEELATTKQP